jgi:DNA-binding response OmpR family regulator
MLLRSLLLCRHSATVEFITRGFREFSVEVVSCSEPQDALDRLGDHRFEAIVVDAEDRGGAMLILDSLKALPSNKNSLRVVLADRETALGTAFSTGTHLVIYKPISAERLRNSIGALCNLMGRRRQRESNRIRVRLPAMVNIAGKNQVPASILDISQGGVALSTQQAIPATKTLELQFALPGKTGQITTSADVVWNDVRGRIGAQFVDMEPASRKVLCEWVAAQLSSTRLHRAAIAKSQA